MCAFIFVKTAGGHIINGIDNPFRVFLRFTFLLLLVTCSVYPCRFVSSWCKSNLRLLICLNIMQYINILMHI